MKEIGKVEINGEKISIMLGKYNKGGDAIQLYCDEGPYATLSVNIPEISLEPGQIAVKTWMENESLREPMLGTGLFEDTGIRVPAGHADAEIWKLRTLH